MVMQLLPDSLTEPPGPCPMNHFQFFQAPQISVIDGFVHQRKGLFHMEADDLELTSVMLKEIGQEFPHHWSFFEEHEDGEEDG